MCECSLGEGWRGKERILSSMLGMRSWPEPKSSVGHLADLTTQEPPI